MTLSYDFIVIGATSFVGRILCRALLDCDDQIPGFKWAIAGRSQDKLNQLRLHLGDRFSQVTRFVVDVTDEAALRLLCGQTAVILSTVGPYALYGETLLKVCAETGTDYCDLTGEVQWIRRMLATYEPVAQRSGAKIVHCCGFDSVPFDLGVHYLQQQSQQRLGQYCQRVKMRVKSAQGSVSGGTLASILNLGKEINANPSLQQEMSNPYSLCPDFQGADHQPDFHEADRPRISLQVPVQYDRAFESWIGPFIMAEVNTRIVLRSHALLNHPYGAAFHYDEAVLTGGGWGGWLKAQGLKLGLETFILAAAVAPSSWFLSHILGPKPGEGPSDTVQAEGFYDLRFWGQTATGETLQVKVRGDRDPGYGSTAKIFAQVGLLLAQDAQDRRKTNSPTTGGFWTPATLWGDRLIDRLGRFAGLSFEVDDEMKVS
jgi:short subunit dehydrogenase-like uncharacterized protein